MRTESGSTGMAVSGFVWIDGTLHCEGMAADRLAREHGTPLYVYSRAVYQALWCHLFAQIKGSVDIGGVPDVKDE